MDPEQTGVDKGTELKNAFVKAYDDLDLNLGERKAFAPGLLRMADAIEAAIEMTLNEADVTPQTRHLVNRDRIMSRGLVASIGNSPIGDDLSKDPDYHSKVNNIADSVKATWKAKNALRDYKK